MSQRVIFDTSGVNRLAKDSDSQPLIAALGCGYSVGLTAMSVDELVASRNVEYRKKFFRCCRQISAEKVRCLMPAGLLIQTMVANYTRDPSAFNWTQVNVRLNVYEDAIMRDEEIIADEELSAEQRDFAQERSETFEDWFSKLRPKLQKIYEDAGEKPHAYADVLRLSQEEGGIIWGFAKELYRCAQEWNAAPDGPSRTERSERLAGPDDDTVKRFVNSCPSFRAAVIAFMLTWYDRCLRENLAEPKFKAGCVDQYMAVYLPYCHQFITNDKYQQKCLQEVATVCGLNTRVYLYDDFYSSFMVKTTGLAS